MAAADYYLCDICYNKTFYDVDLIYDRVGEMVVICKKCAETHKITINRKEPGNDE